MSYEDYQEADSTKSISNLQLSATSSQRWAFTKSQAAYKLIDLLDGDLAS